MHQRLSVRAIVRRDGKTLLLKRANGRPSILGQFELPGGRVAQDEQPDDAIRRYLRDDVGLETKAVQLVDAISYTDHDQRDIQYGVMIYMVGLKAGSQTPQLSSNYNKYLWRKLKNIQHDKLTELSQIILNVFDGYHGNEPEESGATTVNVDDVIKTSSDKITVYSDGGSRGNPGNSAAGYVLIDSRGDVIAQGGEFLGITTNNQAEYHGVRIGLEEALKRGYKQVDFKIDSMLVVNQLNNIYQIKNRELWPINERVQELVSQFDKVSFSHVKREFNKLADGMVNRVLDQAEHQNKV